MHTSPAPYGPQFMFCSRIVNDCCNCVCVYGSRAVRACVSSFMNHLVEECDSPHLRAKSVILLSTKSTIDDLSVRRISICYCTMAAQSSFEYDNRIRSMKDATTNHLQRNENARKKRRKLFAFNVERFERITNVQR